MADHPWLVERFEAQRARLRAVAYRVLGSVSEAEDAVQESWLRFSGTSAGEIENIGAWLTTVVARISLNMLRARKVRATHVPEPIVDRIDGVSSEHEALLADSVGLALLVVLESLSAPERIAFVLHDVFDLPFEEIAPVLERSPDATRQLASRARRRVEDGRVTPDDDLITQRTVVEAFLTAARTGDVAGLVAVLAPDVVLRSDAGPAPLGTSVEVRGAKKVAGRARGFQRLGLTMHPVLVNGAAGLVSMRAGAPFSVMAFTVERNRIARIDILADPDRVRALDLSWVDR